MSLGSGTGAITVITSESQHYLHCSPLSQAEEYEAWVEECGCRALSFTSSTFYILVHTLVFASISDAVLLLLLLSILSHLPYTQSYILSLSYKNTCSYIHPYLVLFVQQNLFQWDGNQMKGNHAVTVQLLIVPPTPSSLLTVSPKQDRCSVCMLPAFPTSILLPGIPDYCCICLIVLSECLLFVQCDVLEVSASIQNVPGRNTQ